MSGRAPPAPTSSPSCRDEILRVISKHLDIDQDKVSVKMERGAQMSTLAVDVEIPFQASKAAPRKQAA